MNLQEMIDTLGLTPITAPKEYQSIIPSCGYASDLLSCVMSGAARQSVWVTLQAHINIVAVATLLDLSAIIITEDAKPDENTVNKANEEGITILLTEESTFAVVGKLWQMGLRCEKPGLK
jgi:hypothetical protein